MIYSLKGLLKAKIPINNNPSKLEVVIFVIFYYSLVIFGGYSLLFLSKTVFINLLL